jgi:hypothetical protein
MARGFSPDSSRSLGRHLCRVALAHSFSVARQLVVAPHDGPLVKVWCRAEQGSLGDPPRPEGGARVASLQLGYGGCGWGKLTTRFGARRRSPGVGFYRGCTPDVLCKDTLLILSPYRPSNCRSRSDLKGGKIDLCSL